jgi:hypothetical protein
LAFLPVRSQILDMVFGLTGVIHYRQQWASGQKAVLSAG